MKLACLLRRRSTCMLCAAALFAPLGAIAADLTLSVSDGPSMPATLYVAIFDSAESFAANKALAQQTLPLQGGAARAAFLGLPAGRYAIRTFADENDNGKLDTNLVGLPIERYGFSNDAKGKLGAPGFDAAAITVEADSNTAIHLR